MEDSNIEKGASSSSDFTSVQWRQRLERHDKIKKIVHLEHIRSIKIDDQVHRAVIENDIASLDGFRDFSGYLNEGNYFNVMKTVLQVEEAYRAINMRKFDLFKQTLAFEKTEYYKDNWLNHGLCLKVTVPKLASDGLFLLSGDTVVFYDEKSDTFKGGKIGKLRAKEVLVPVERYKHNKVFLGRLLDIFFVSDGLNFSYLEEGLDRTKSSQSIRLRLFELSQGSFSKFDEPKINIEPESRLVHKSLLNLDDFQCEAVENILAAYCRPKPYILLGSTGTGKTNTLAEAIAQIYVRDKESKILFCASSHVSVNHMVNKLKQLNNQPIRHRDIYSIARGDNKRVHKQFSRIHLTATATSHCYSGDIQYDYVFIDDACRASELECLLPICSLKEDGCLVLAGDLTQFKPIFQCQQLSEMGLGRSLLERMLKLDDYKVDPDSNSSDQRFISKLLITYSFLPRSIFNKKSISNQLKRRDETPRSNFPRSKVEFNECWKRHKILMKLGDLDHIRSFKIGKDVYSAVVNQNTAAVKNLPDIEDFLRSGQLNVENYQEVMLTVLQVEEAYRAIDMRKFDMFAQKLFFKSRSGGYNTVTRTPSYVFGIKVEALATEDLFLMPGDVMVMHDPTTNTYKQAEIKQIDHNVVLVPIAQTGVNRVFINKPLNISFISKGFTNKWLEDAVECALFSTIMVSSQDSFDEFDGPKISLELSPALDCEELDTFQRKAVEGILQKECRPKPYIVFGPPGTGKTHTLVEAIAQIYAREKKARVLFCANANVCVDHMMQKLEKVIGSRDIERFSAGESIKDRFECLRSARIHLTTNMKSYNLHEYFEYDYVFIDEAGHAHEPESLLPVRLLRANGCLVLAGDPKQLGPVIMCKQICDLKLDKSLLERLFEFGIYKRDSNTNQYNDKYITKLLRCYRCDPRVMAISNKLFYDNELECCNRTPPSILKIMKLSGPLQFVHVDGHESRSEDSTSLYNMEEVNCCVDLIVRLCHMGLEPDQIGVISPYKLQVIKIIKKLKHTAPHLFKKYQDETFGNSDGTSHSTAEDVPSTEDGDCKIASVDAFQGNEREVIILSTVRSYPRGKLDFLEEPRRFNVALTRAKWLQIVVGHQDVLAVAENWSECVKDAAKDEIQKYLAKELNRRDETKARKDGVTKITKTLAINSIS